MFTITTVKATKPPTYTIVDTRGEPVQGTFYADECARNLPNRTSAQEGKRPSVCQVERLQRSIKSWIPLADVEQL